MISSIRPWGNSQGIYIPKKLLKEAAMDLNESVELKIVDEGILICKDESRANKERALESLRAIRAKHAGDAGTRDKNYREEFEEYLDERYNVK